jgi:hypothetical protein
MATDLKPIDISSRPDLSRLVDDMTEEGTGFILMRGDKAVAVIEPVVDTPQRPEEDSPEELASIDDDPIMGLFGILDSGEPTSIARFKDEYIADAIDHKTS